MRKLGLKSVKFTRKSRKYSSYKELYLRGKERIHRRFTTLAPHQKVKTDTSEFKYYESGTNGKSVIKKLYLDSFLDLFNGEILSYQISENPNAKSVLNAQKEAIDYAHRRTFHSDQG